MRSQLLLREDLDWNASFAVEEIKVHCILPLRGYSTTTSFYILFYVFKDLKILRTVPQIKDFWHTIKQQIKVGNNIQDTVYEERKYVNRSKNNSILLWKHIIRLYFYFSIFLLSFFKSFFESFQLVNQPW